MGSQFYFGVPCYALAHKECDDTIDGTIEMAHSIVAMEFGNMGRCALLFRDQKTVDEAGRALGHDIVVMIENAPFLELILKAEKGYGSSNFAVDLVRTKDGQTACDFLSIDEMLRLN
jgi:hypothetical protein